MKRNRKPRPARILDRDAWEDFIAIEAEELAEIHDPATMRKIIAERRLAF